MDFFQLYINDVPICKMNFFESKILSNPQVKTRFINGVSTGITSIVFVIVTETVTDPVLRSIPKLACTQI